MGWLFENFQILIVIGIAIAAWLKNRGDTAAEEEAEREAREEMIRHLQEMDDRPIERTAPPPVPKRWDTSPQSQSNTPPKPPEIKPPPLKDIFNEVVQQLEPVPGMFQQAKPKDDAYDDEPAPWEDFRHADASHSEIRDHGEPAVSPVLERQRKMQERLAELKAKAAEYKGKAAGARETQRRTSGKSTSKIADMPSIAEVLKDRSQTRRAIILNEILSKPVGLRS